MPYPPYTESAKIDVGPILPKKIKNPKIWLSPVKIFFYFFSFPSVRWRSGRSLNWIFFEMQCNQAGPSRASVSEQAAGRPVHGHMSRAFVNHPKKIFSRSRANFSHITLPSFPFLSPYLPLRAIAPGLRKPPQKKFFRAYARTSAISLFLHFPSCPLTFPTVQLPSNPGNRHTTTPNMLNVEEYQTERKRRLPTPFIRFFTHAY